MNEGKIFEEDFKKSVEGHGYFYHRLKDAAQSFGSQNNGLRFSSKNPYDCIMFANRHLFTLELKSTKGTSFSFWRKDFENKDKTIKQTFLIHKHQIEGLQKSDKFLDVVSGFVLNFRTANRTYFWKIKDFLEYTNKLDKKSFNEDDVIKGHGIIIPQEIRRVRYSYNIKDFVINSSKIMFI